MEEKYVNEKSLSELKMFQKSRQKRILTSLYFDITARCNNNCSHCYINENTDDEKVKSNELSFEEIRTIIDEAFSIGVLDILLTGGEPLLRDDFFEIYRYTKSKGFLVTVFTNATLLTEKHIEIFKKYRPREIEVTVYGVSPETYAKVTGQKDLFNNFIHGVNLLVNAKLPLSLKTTVTKSNVKEFHEIASFCKDRTLNPFRFDMFLHLRYDRNQRRNKQIINQRLNPDEICELELSNAHRKHLLQNACKKILANDITVKNNKLFKCQGGYFSCGIDYKGFLKLCPSLCHSDCIYNLKTGSLKDGWQFFLPRVMNKISNRPSYLDYCGSCPKSPICSACPAHTDLEIGSLDGLPDYFCKVANKKFDVFL